MRLTKKDTSFCFKGSGCNLRYIGTQPLNIEINEENIDFVEGFINKLGQLEDIEDELGIDLITLFKALKNGIWVYTKNNDIIHTFVLFGFDWNVLHFHPLTDKSLCGAGVYIKHYGKTWALTKEELL